MSQNDQLSKCMSPSHGILCNLSEANTNTLIPFSFQRNIALIHEITQSRHCRQFTQIIRTEISLFTHNLNQRETELCKLYVLILKKK